MRRTVLSFLAHPDDAEILCAGTLARLAGLGWTVHIATATAGDCGTATRSAAEISAIRIAEACKAAALIHATYHCLGELDGFVLHDAPTLRKAYALFREINPGLVLTHPREDYMLDHEQVSLLARAASFIYAAPNVIEAPQRPTDASVPWLYYCDPIGGVDASGRLVGPSTLIDISKFQAVKLEMLACHASQREWLAAHHGMDEYLDATRRHDAERGKLLGVVAAEAFVQHRGHAYPHDDLLHALLG